jgi:SAM-dependent methyltransferase
MLQAQNYQKLQDVMTAYAPWVKTSAEQVLSYLDLKDKTLVDFGCGRGTWLETALNRGAQSVLGLDTHALENETLQIPVRYVDLSKQVQLETKYDYAICLEVAEHLPIESAPTLVRSLCNAASIVLFSAAIPGQGGMYHLNEQPPQYWSELFFEHDFECYDFRSLFWNDPLIQPWYRCNTLVFAHKGASSQLGALTQHRVQHPLHLVHPDIFEAYAVRERNIILHFDEFQKHWYPEMLASEGSLSPIKI